MRRAVRNKGESTGTLRQSGELSFAEKHWRKENNPVNCFLTTDKVC